MQAISWVLAVVSVIYLLEDFPKVDKLGVWYTSVNF
jgi:hypothetical protein